MRKYKSKIAAAVHEAMQDARYAGAIDKCTMRQFDASCLTPAELLSAREIQRLRKREGVSQMERALEAPGSVGSGSSWDAEYNLCVVQLVTSELALQRDSCMKR